MAERITVYLLWPDDRPFAKAEWIEPGTTTRRSRSLRTADPAEAERKRADLEYELNHGLTRSVSGLTWAAFREQFERAHVDGLRPRSREKYQTVFTVFERGCRPNKLRDVNADMLTRFVKHMRQRKKGGKVGLAPWTQRNYLVALHTAIDWAVKQKYLPEMPSFPTIKVPKLRPRPIPDSEFEALLAAEPDQRWRTAWMCGWWAGLRLREIMELRWGAGEEYPWVDLEAARIVLPARFAKADEDQWLPVHAILGDALRALERTPEQERVFAFWSARTKGLLTRHGWGNRMVATAEKAGVKLTAHKLRKGFGCRVAKKLGKGNAPILHRLMRHKSMQVTMDFYASVDDCLHESIKDL